MSQLDDINYKIIRAARSDTGTINLSNMQLKEYPSELFKHDFTEIDLSNNLLQDIDDRMTALMGLQKLILKNNKIVRVSPGAKEHLTFIEVDLEGNPLKNLDDEVDPEVIKKLESESLSSEIELLRDKMSALEIENYNLSNVNEFLNVHVIQKDKLETGEEIGRGGFSIIYQGYYLNTKVAIKKVFDPVMSENLLKETKNEIICLNRIRHPNIVSIIGILWTPPELILLFEWLDMSLYKSLHELKNKYEGEKLKALLLKICKGIEFIHFNGYVHKDIKSHNVLMGEGGYVKVCDFGLCHKVADRSAMSFGGTMHYMAPELIRKQDYDASADVYAVGTLMWEVATGCTPFENYDEVMIMDAIRDDIGLDYARVKNAKLKELIKCCRHKDADKRPSISDVINGLKEI